MKLAMGTLVRAQPGLLRDFERARARGRACAAFALCLVRPGAEVWAAVFVRFADAERGLAAWVAGLGLLAAAIAAVDPANADSATC